MMLRTLVVIGLIGQAGLHVLGFLTSWAAVRHVIGIDLGFSFGNPVFATPAERLIALLWAVAIACITAAVIAGFVVCGFALLLRRRWWRLVTIVCAATSLVAILPWVALISPWIISTIIGVDVGILVALVLPWGDRITEALQWR